MSILSQKRVVDKMIEAYVVWHEACLLVRNTYELWTCESGSGAKVAFARYETALDRESQAADVYAVLVRRVARFKSRNQLRAGRLDTQTWGVPG